MHLGVDNLGVVRHFWRLLNGHHGSIPFELVTDGDLVLLIERMLQLWGLDTVRVTKVKGHAEEGMVLDGRVREQDKVRNNAADEAADFGRRRVGNAVIDARRNLSGVCGRWYPVIIIRIGSSLPFLGPLLTMTGMILILWFGPLVLFPKGAGWFMQFVTGPFLPRPPAIWDSEWMNVPASAISADDIAHWPHTTGLLVNWVAFLGSLHWPAGSMDLGVGGISYVELLILHKLWAGERLSLEKAHPRYLRPGHPISVSAVPFGPGTGIWRSCPLIGAMMRSLCLLPGGLGRFVPCSMGGNHSRLRHIGCMDLPRDHERVLRRFSWMSYCSSFSTLLGFPVRCLLVHFPLGTALLGLLVGSLLGGCRCLDMLLALLRLILGLLRVVGLRLLVGRFTCLVVLDQDGKEFD